VRALTDELALRGVTLNEFVPAISKYPPQPNWQRPFWLPAALAARLPGIAASRGHDITLLQRELISTLFTLEPITGKPRVLDVDDAIFLHRDGKTARRLAERCELVLAGNEFLADWFSQFNPRVELLPTSIDTNRFKPANTPTGLSPGQQQQDTITIGWTGSQTNLPYLQFIEPALQNVLAARPQTQLHVVCDKPPNLPALPNTQLRFSQWSRANEVDAVQRFDIGIMPLTEGDWERGKCAFKILQYMACSKPVVASPVGVNAELLADERIGFAAGDLVLWENALLELIDDADLRRRQGAAGRALAQARYDTSVIAQRLAGILRSAL